MLTTEDMQKITVDAIVGRKQRVTGPEAEVFLKKVEVDIANAKANGQTIEIPPEWEVDVNNEVRTE